MTIKISVPYKGEKNLLSEARLFTRAGRTCETGLPSIFDLH